MPYTPQSNYEDELLNSENEQSGATPIDVDSDNSLENVEDNLQISVTENDISDISDIAAKLELEKSDHLEDNEEHRDTADNSKKTDSSSGNKRYRESSANNSVNTTVSPPSKKIKKTTMSTSEETESAPQPNLQIVRLVPDVDDIYLFCETHVKLIHEAVLKELKKVTNPNVKFEFCEPERGRYKFVCPNEEAKEWALNIVPNLTGLWKNNKIKAVDCGIVPKMIRASVIFANPPPNTMDFFEDIDLKNETIDTNEWRVYKKQKIQGNRTILFIGVDENAYVELKKIGFRPYFANGRTRITIDKPNENN